MAFTMKGSAFYGKGNQSPMKATGDPKKEKSESATTNLLDKLGNYEETVSQKSDRDSDLGQVRYSDLPSMGADYTRDDEDPILHNPKNKKELDTRMTKAKAKQSEGRAQSMEDYIKSTSKTEAADAKAGRVRTEKKAAKAAVTAERTRQAQLGKKGRVQEWKDGGKVGPKPS
tara:strand:+ start:1183 stop:1698 length:516 start_codon:yes stop_codon:yes gene_type:complete